jgi:hypothetical protein
METPSSGRPNKKNVEAFGAIVNFVGDLWETFGKCSSVTPLALYNRLIVRIGLGDVDSIQKAIDGFKEFLGPQEKSIMSGHLETIPRGTVIRYGTSDKVYLEVQKFIYQSDPQTKEIIRQHLLTISTIIAPNKEKMAQLEKRISALNVDTSTREGRFINDIMEKAKTNMTDVDPQDPMKAMMTIFQSGIIQEMVVGLQQGVGSGEMNMQTLLGTMQNAIGAIMPPQTQPTVEEIQEKKEGPD